MTGEAVDARAQRPAPAAWRRARRLLLALDLLAGLFSVLAPMSFYVGPAPWRMDLGAADAESTTVLLVLFVLVTLVALALQGSYSAERRVSRIDDGIVLAKALVYALAIVVVAAFVSKGFGTGFTDYSRRIVLSGVVAALATFGAARLAAWWWQRRAFSRGAGVKQLVVVGTGAAAVEFEGFIATRPWLGARCVGALSVLPHGTEAERSGGMIRPTPVLGRLGDPGCGALCAEVDALVLALDDDERQDLALVVRQVEGYGVPFHIIPSLFERTYAVAGGGYPAGLSTLSYRVEPMYRTQRGLKRLLDTVVALVALTFLSPLFLVVAALVKLTSPGPVFFRQERVGEHGRRFPMLKFRTMYEDAEQRLAEVAHLNEGEDVLFKIRDDPRVTPVGRFLRRWSIDELPQFWNVLRGDMSVVGPRPPLPREVDAYETAQLARLRGKPGITGLWQVSGRSDLDFEQMVDLDRYYLENWSLGLDLSIALRTVLAIVRRRGAY